MVGTDVGTEDGTFEGNGVGSGVGASTQPKKNSKFPCCVAVVPSSMIQYVPGFLIVYVM